MIDDLDAENLATLERIKTLIQGSELREEAWSGAPAKDLADLGIDSAQLRWLAARHYTQELRDEDMRQIRRVWFLATFFDYAEQNAIERLGYCPLEGGPPLIKRDYLTAKARVLEPYKGASRDAAEAWLIEHSLIPSVLS